VTPRDVERREPVCKPAATIAIRRRSRHLGDIQQVASASALLSGDTRWSRRAPAAAKRCAGKREASPADV